MASAAGTAPVDITQFLGNALIYAVGTAVLAVVVYFGYSALLKRSDGN